MWAALVGVALAGLGVLLVPLPEGVSSDPAPTTVLLDRHGESIAWLSGDDGIYDRRLSWPVELDAMGEYLPEVIVGLEDHRFHRHAGIDPHSIVGSAKQNLSAGRIISGASTITQQLVKMSYGRTGRPWRAKIYEAASAIKLERHLEKDAILQAYLNRCHYGNRLYGPQAAAAVYFRKPARELTLQESVFLAGLPQAPTRFNPWSGQQASLDRYSRSVDRLEEVGTISTEDANRCRRFPPRIHRGLPPRKAPHFVDYVLARHPELSGGNAPGRVRTTLDLRLQNRIEDALIRHIRALPGSDVRHGSALVLDHRDGGIRAMVGAPDQFAPGGAVNGTTCFRSSGSTLKPFVYLDAISQGKLTTASILPDTPDASRRAYADYDPNNYDTRHHGPVRLRNALGNSLNVPTIHTLSLIGARGMFGRLGSDWGIEFARPFSAYGAGMVLGNAEVRMVDLVAAYGAIARGGSRIEPRALDTAEAKVSRACDPAPAAIISDVLCDNAARLLTFGHVSPLHIEGVRVAAKTGTSSAFRDAWTVGFTGEHSFAVWVGNMDGKPMDEISSINGAAPVWRSVADMLLETDTGVPEPDREVLPLERVEVCGLTGLLPDDPELSTERVGEWFLRGTAPTEFASTMLDKAASGKVRPLLDDSYANWCASDWNYLNAVTRSGGDADSLGRSLQIAFPTSGSVFLVDRSLPMNKQHLRLRATFIGDVQGEVGGVDRQREVRWEVNGSALESDRWLLEVGTHSIVAIGTRGGRAEVDIEVR